jgi:hypothetical protein
MKFLTPVAVLLVILKLSAVVSWSWWIVLIPLYLMIALVAFEFLMALTVFAGIGIMIVDLFLNRRK